MERMVAQVENHTISWVDQVESDGFQDWQKSVPKKKKTKQQVQVTSNRPITKAFSPFLQRMFFI